MFLYPHTVVVVVVVCVCVCVWEREREDFSTQIQRFIFQSVQFFLLCKTKLHEWDFKLNIYHLMPFVCSWLLWYLCTRFEHVGNVIVACMCKMELDMYLAYHIYKMLTSSHVTLVRVFIQMSTMKQRKHNTWCVWPQKLHTPSIVSVTTRF
jgi:hypothetical protein